MKRKQKCLPVVRLICMGVCVAMLCSFGVRTARDIGRIRRGEMTAAQAIEETMDWLRGKNKGTPNRVP